MNDPDLALSGGTCSEPLVSTHPDRQGSQSLGERLRKVNHDKKRPAAFRREAAQYDRGVKPHYGRHGSRPFTWLISPNVTKPGAAQPARSVDSQSVGLGCSGARLVTHGDILISRSGLADPVDQAGDAEGARPQPRRTLPHSVTAAS